MNTKNSIVTRYDKNPILTIEDVPYPVATVHNAGVVKHNGIYTMLFRSHQYNGRSIIGRADSDDGLSFTVHPKPFLKRRGCPTNVDRHIVDLSFNHPNQLPLRISDLGMQAP